jgi:hypothetical protein
MEKQILLEAFEGVDQGSLSSFCGVEINIDEKGIVPTPVCTTLYYVEQL